MMNQTRAVGRFISFLPVRSMSNASSSYGSSGSVATTSSSSGDKTTEYVKTFLAAIKKEDPVVRALKEIKVDYDKMGSAGRQTLVINTILANLYLGEVIGVVPLLSGVGAYLSYKYLKHTGKLAQWRESLRNK